MTEILGEEGTEQFTVQTYIGDRLLKSQPVHDPFIRTMVSLGWVDLLKGLLIGRLKIRVVLDGSHAARTRIMTMNPREMQRENEVWEAELKERHGTNRLYGTVSCDQQATRPHS